MLPLLAPSIFLALSNAHESRREKIEYGTYTVPSRREDNGMLAIHSKEIEPPCVDCAVTFMQAHLEFEDGSRADAEKGMWMHHVVFQNTARRDGICGSERRMGERFFASGNERGTVDFEESKEEAGYFFEADDKLRFHGELMNMNDDDRKVVFSVTWGFVEKPGKSMRPVTPYWLDIGGCGSSEKPAANMSYFSYTSPPLESDFEGQIVLIGTHLHDGGEKLGILRNGKPMCISLPTYSEGKEAHITEMPHCVDPGEVSAGEEWRIQAHYDTYKYTPMVNEDGSLEPVMGIALAYVAKGDATPVKSGRSSGWVVFFFILVALLVMGAVGYVIWNRRRVSVWPRWASGRQSRQYGALDGPGRQDEGEALVGDEEEDDNVWAQPSPRASVRLPGGNAQL